MAERLPWFFCAEANKPWLTILRNNLQSHAALMEALQECIMDQGALAFRKHRFACQRLNHINESAKAALARAEGE